MNKRQKIKYLGDLIAKYQIILNLNEWNIEYHLMDRDLDNEGNITTYADTTILPEYLTCSMRVYPSFFRRIEKLKVDVIAHELAHCHTQVLFNMAKDLSRGVHHTMGDISDCHEMLTQRMANLALRVK